MESRGTLKKDVKLLITRKNNTGFWGEDKLLVREQVLPRPGPRGVCCEAAAMLGQSLWDHHLQVKIK